jgi:tRNA threonylcarbamoyladenosine biosynthesis protein TsaB
MIVLAFDTCFDACSVCVAQSREAGTLQLASALERFETRHAERLIPMIEEAMRDAGIAFGAIDRVAVTTGPGTFTGTRIGVAAARGIALSTGIATVGVSSLAVMAEVARRDLGELAKGCDLAVAVDARRCQAYAQLLVQVGSKRSRYRNSFLSRPRAGLEIDRWSSWARPPRLSRPPQIALAA